MATSRCISLEGWCTENDSAGKARPWLWVGSVRRPLDLGDVDPLLDHLEQRRHLPQPAHLPDHEVGDVVDLLPGGEPADAEPDAAVGQLVADAQRPQDVTRLQAGARAGRP